MSRSGYTDDYDYDDGMWASIRWRGAVKSAIRGKRGQAFLKEMLAAMDALPERKLIAGELEEPTGPVCALGAVGRFRGVDMTEIDPEDYEAIALVFGISEALAREIMFENDEVYTRQAPDARFDRMLRWAKSNIKKEEA
jgi:hypothetical protein